MASQKIKDVPKPPDFDQLIKDLNSEQRNEVLDLVPDWFGSFKERASRLGKTVKELLEAERKALRESDYPGPECLEPYELELYVKGVLHQDRISHKNECVPCAALLKTAAPTDARLNSLIAEIRNEAEKSLRINVTTDDTRKRIFVDALATALPVGVGVWAAVFFYWYRLPSNASDQIVNSAAWVIIQSALLGLIVLLGVIAVLRLLVQRSNLLTSYRLLASSGGALAVSVTLGFFLFYGTYRSLISHTRTSELEMTLLQFQLTQTIATSVNNYDQDSALVNFASGPVDVRRTSNTPNKITYEATARDVPGKLVAQVRDDMGELYWQPSKKKPENEEVAKLLLGTVKSFDSNNIAVVDKSGVSHNLKLTRALSPMPSRGERVLAVFEPTSLRVESVYSIPKSR